MKHKLFIIFALVLVFGAMMAFSVSAETSSYVVYADVSGKKGLAENYHDLSSDFGYNPFFNETFLYSSDTPYVVTVDQIPPEGIDGSIPIEGVDNHDIFPYYFFLGSFQPEKTSRQNWFAFLENDYVLSNQYDIALTVIQECAVGESYYVYGEEYETYVLVASRDNKHRFYLRIKEPKSTANIVVPKGYEIMVYTVFFSNIEPGKTFDIRLGMRTGRSDALVSGQENFVQCHPFTDAYLSSIGSTYDEGFSAGKEECSLTHASLENAAKAECASTHKALVDAAFKEGESFFETFANFFFEKKTVNGQPQYSGILGGIFQAYLDVANGISLFGISLHTVLLTLLILVVLGVGIKFVLSVI